MTDHFRGHPIEYNGKWWVFSDTKESTAKTWKDRPCGHCKQYNTKEGHDACLGTLPGVMNACCGHGRTDGAYVQYNDGMIVRGLDAVKAFKTLKE